MSDEPLREPIAAHAVHLCIDMQNLFAPGAPWETPWLARVLPRVEELAGTRPHQTLFTRFLPPRQPSGRPGTWQRLYRCWPQVTRSQADPRLFDLVPSLQQFIPPAQVIDKGYYSPFFRSGLLRLLAQRRVDTLVISGAETDMCVLAVVMDAVDLGLRTVIAEDAICSSSDGTHDALMKLYRERFSNQIELADTRTILANWSR